MIYDLESTSFFVGTQSWSWAMDRSVFKAWEDKIDVLYCGSKGNVIYSWAQGEPPWTTPGIQALRHELSYAPELLIEFSIAKKEERKNKLAFSFEGLGTKPELPRVTETRGEWPTWTMVPWQQIQALGGRHLGRYIFLSPSFKGLQDFFF